MATKSPTIYRAKCLNCGHEWTSKSGYGIPKQCPKSTCKSDRI